MSDFALFAEALEEYKQHEKSTEVTITKNDCSHKNIVFEKGINLCVDCGEEISKNISYDKEWVCYGKSNGQFKSDPSRVNLRKMDERNIFKDVQNMGFSDKIVTQANDIYTQVTKGQIKRGNSRKAIVFACIFQAYKLSGSPLTHEYLIKAFNLTRKTGLQGLKHVILNAPKHSEIHTTHITPVHFIQEIMQKFQASNEQMTSVTELYNRIKNRNTKLNSARPQSVAAGLTYYWIYINKKNINLQEFAKKVELSELTIGRVAKIISGVLGTEHLLE